MVRTTKYLCNNIARPSERKSPTLRKIIKPIIEYENEENQKRALEVKNSKDKKEILENQLKKLKLGNSKNVEETIQKIENINFELTFLEVVDYLRLIVDDITSEEMISVMAKNKERIGVFSAEGGIFNILAGMYNNNISNFDIFLKAYSGDLVRVDRKGRETEKLDNPLITLLLFVQPHIINTIFFNNDFKGKGFCARFLYCYPESLIGHRDINSKPVPKDIEDKYNKKIKEMLSINNIEPKIFKLSSEAYLLSQKFAMELEKELRIPSKSEEWKGKLHGSILRIAGNLHLFENTDNNNLEISNIVMSNAIKIGNYYKQQAEQIYEGIADTEEEFQAKRIIKMIKEKGLRGEIKRSNLYNKVRGSGMNKTINIEKPLKILIERDYIREVKYEKNNNKVGRPRDIILQLNPNIF